MQYSNYSLPNYMKSTKGEIFGNIIFDSVKLKEIRRTFRFPRVSQTFSKYYFSLRILRNDNFQTISGQSAEAMWESLKNRNNLNYCWKVQINVFRKKTIHFSPNGQFFNGKNFMLICSKYVEKGIGTNSSCCLIYENFSNIFKITNTDAQPPFDDYLLLFSFCLLWWLTLVPRNFDTEQHLYLVVC